jgi:hypothetical protein
MPVFVTHIQRDESSLSDVDILFQQTQEHATTYLVSLRAQEVQAKLANHAAHSGESDIV